MALSREPSASAAPGERFLDRNPICDGLASAGDKIMNVSINQRKGRKSQPAFWLVAWATLLVVLLSAAPTGGQPRTRFVGSAFDPATVSVVVTPKKHRSASSAASLLKRKRPDDVAGEAPTIVSLPRRPAASPLALADRLRFSPFPDATSRRHSFPKAHGPRAPPTA